MEELTFVFEMIGTIAFAISGAIVGLRKKTDLFGVTALGIVTATGGGVIRDVILGVNPPSSFVDPIYVLVAFLTGLAVFILAAYRARKGCELTKRDYRRVLLYMDSIGLGIFSVMGVKTAYFMFPETNGFLCVFCGMVTGVGGGLLRDMMVDTLPDIFHKYIYAVASLFGALISFELFQAGKVETAIWFPTAVVFVVRLFASYYQWSLPRIANFESKQD